MAIPHQETAEWVERLARLGYGAKALLYGTIGMLAGQAALGLGGGATDTRGAMGAISRAPFGKVLLALCALGLVGYGVWRMIAAVTDAEHRGHDLKGLSLRGSFLVRGLFHLVIAWSAVRIVFGWPPVGQDKLTRAGNYGTLVLLLAGAGIAGYGLYQIYKAWHAKLSKQINKSHMTREAGPWVYPVARFGIAARGVVFCLIGYLTAKASRTPSTAGDNGIQASLQAFADVGRIPLGVVAAGVLAYAFYEVLNVRYRHIRT